MSTDYIAIALVVFSAFLIPFSQIVRWWVHRPQKQVSFELPKVVSGTQGYTLGKRGQSKNQHVRRLRTPGERALEAQRRAFTKRHHGGRLMPRAQRKARMNAYLAVYG